MVAADYVRVGGIATELVLARVVILGGRPCVNTRNGGEVLPSIASVGGVFPQVGVAAGGHLHHIALRYGARRYVSGERRLGGGGQQTELRTCLRVGRGLATRRHSGLHVVGAALGSTVGRSEGSSVSLGDALGVRVGCFLQGVGEVRWAHPRDEALFVLSHALHRDGSSPACPVVEVSIIGAKGRARAIVEALGDSHRRGRTTLPCLYVYQQHTVYLAAGFDIHIAGERPRDLLRNKLRPAIHIIRPCNSERTGFVAPTVEGYLGSGEVAELQGVGSLYEFQCLHRSICCIRPAPVLLGAQVV